MDGFKHSVPTQGLGQKNFQQCWYASYRMMYKYYNLPLSSVDDKLDGTSIDTEDAKQKGLVDKEFKYAAWGLGMTILPSAPFKDTTWTDFDVSSGAYTFLDELKKGPLWVSRYIRPGCYHAVVAIGYSDEGKGYIIYNNPFPGPNNAIVVANLTASSFVRDITDASGSVQAYR